MIDVLLVEDNVRVRQTVKQELEQHAELRVVGEAADGIAGLHLALSLRPHVVVMDIGLSRLDGIEATRRIKTAIPDTVVIGSVRPQR
jgi:NarL family two-component system response regulator LiaR